jgi:hypothetical protein
VHPDKQTVDPTGGLFIKLQETYHIYKSHKEAIKRQVDQHGLASLNEHLPREKEQSIIDLLEALNAMLQVHIENCDKHLALFKQSLSEQEAELVFLTGEIDALSQGIERIKQVDLVIDEKLQVLNEDMAVRDKALGTLLEDSKAYTVALEQISEEVQGFEESIRLLVMAQIKEMKEWAGEGEAGVQAEEAQKTQKKQKMQKGNDSPVKTSDQITFFPAARTNHTAPACYIRADKN